jgi:hypothetical protein
VCIDSCASAELYILIIFNIYEIIIFSAGA